MSEVTAVPLRPVGKNGVVALWVGIAAVLAAGLGGALYATTAPRNAAVAAPGIARLPAAEFLALNGKRSGVITTPSGLQYKIIKPGAGPRPTFNDIALVDYRGALTNGTVFDATKPGQPATLPLSRVVPGFAESLSLIPKGGTYRVWLPPALGYGTEDQRDENGAVVIPGNSVLVFDITTHAFQPMPQQGPAPGQ